MKGNLAASLERILKHEGGYAERATEGGGAVNMGITFTTFESHWHKSGKPGKPTFQDLREMTREAAIGIYDDLYAKKIDFDRLPKGFDYVLLDSAVNNGVGGAIQNLQVALRLPVTKKWSPSLSWAARTKNATVLINLFCDTRLKRQKTFRDYNTPTKIGGKTTFGMVWDRRVEEVRKTALAMLGGN